MQQQLGLASTATVMAKGTFFDGVKLCNQGHYQEAFRIFEGYAKQGDADAQFSLALLYDYGNGVKKI